MQSGSPAGVWHGEAMHNSGVQVDCPPRTYETTSGRQARQSDTPPQSPTSWAREGLGSSDLLQMGTSG